MVAGLRTNVIITLDQLTEILNDDDGTGDDVLLKMTNGATITGRDLVSRMLADIGLVTLVHPVKGPVNLYRLSRFANSKQRLMAMAENPTCPWDGCYHPADSAQIHHLKAWKYGGHTNPENLTVACPYHNGVNDDDPSTPRHGRLERVNGKSAASHPGPPPTTPQKPPRLTESAGIKGAQREKSAPPEDTLHHSGSAPDRQTSSDKPRPR